MVFISLGFACLVRQSIDGFNHYRVETNFFDWLMTNFSTVLLVFQNLDNPDKFLTTDKFIDKGILENNLTHRCVEHKQINFTSLHDFPAEQSYWDYVNTFIQKYSRRMARLKNIIQTSQEKINFIHYIAFPNYIPTIEEIYFFIIKVKEIKQNENFCLHLLIPPEIHHLMEKIDKLKICNNVKIHYMISDGSRVNLQRTDLNFKAIYHAINHS